MTKIIIPDKPSVSINAGFDHFGAVEESGQRRRVDAAVEQWISEVGKRVAEIINRARGVVNRVAGELPLRHGGGGGGGFRWRIAAAGSDYVG